ncbi:translation initiation factor 2 [Pseudomonas sp. HMWF032]|uniref:translation initiation factor 2 n=1 Tax=unclassified Pseudomonas TaxID=196821 RepID=UPI000D3C5568|nr:MULTISPECIES: translation initiation factor 2 [unclassified Pseudomonas]PTS83595.1 translation initiation factor 2 [Pseudomonas sp. HMWF032]PTT84045.1 translation initiation factor 2 [Pseudomonas sp. HMWF010]WAC44831.1 translation initiation factor 2 [Pseudomonas sp. SL4(2022)]
MRPGPLFLLLTLCLPATIQAEEIPPQPLAEATSVQAQIDDLEQRLALSEEQREALSAELQSTTDERETLQLQRLRQENQRLKLQLKKLQASAPPPLISEQQMWYAIGAGSTLLGVLIGALLRRGRRSHSEWLN